MLGERSDYSAQLPQRRRLLCEGLRGEACLLVVDREFDASECLKEATGFQSVRAEETTIVQFAPPRSDFRVISFTLQLDLQESVHGLSRSPIVAEELPDLLLPDGNVVVAEIPLARCLVPGHAEAVEEHRVILQLPFQQAAEVALREHLAGIIGDAGFAAVVAKARKPHALPPRQRHTGERLGHAEQSSLALLARRGIFQVASQLVGNTLRRRPAAHDGAQRRLPEFPGGIAGVGEAHAPIGNFDGQAASAWVTDARLRSAAALAQIEELLACIRVEVRGEDVLFQAEHLCSELEPLLEPLNSCPSKQSEMQAYAPAVLRIVHIAWLWLRK